MEPVSATLAAGTALKAVGALHSGYSQSAQAKSQATAAEFNRDLANQNAATTSAQAGLREEQMRREARQVQGAQRAAVAEGGTGFVGSNLDILNQDAVTASLDALNTRYEGQLQSTGYRNDAITQDYQAKGFKKQAKAAKVGAWLSAGSAIIQGASSYASGGGKIPGVKG
jgi:hypothetical protein